MKIEYSRQIFEKCQISNFMEFRPVGAEDRPKDGRTDRHDEENSRFWQFCERA
jgi:hypothetical protein